MGYLKQNKVERDSMSPLTFEDVMTYDARNTEVYCDILERYKKKGIIPFVGAGLSEPAGFKGWNEFLEHEYATLKREYPESMDNTESPSNPLDKASELCNKMGLAGFNQAVVKAFGGKYSDIEWSPIIGRVQNAAVGLLPKLFHEIVVTTNFDRLLEQLYPKTLVSHPGHYSLLNSVLEKGLPRGTSLILKLHGCVSDPNHLIFTRESYTKAYPEIGDTPFTIALETIFTSQTVLFLGCSLKDDHTVKQWAKTLLQPRGEGRTHFAIISCEQNKRLEKRRDLGNMNIHPILYPKGNHDAVRVILERLYRDTNGGKPLSNLMPKNDYFTGREEQLENLKKDFEQGSVHVKRVISGLGGMGKTQTALEYAHRHLDEYANGVLWLNAESELDLTNSCREILIKVGALDKVQAVNIKPDELLNRWQHWLGEHRNRLLIFDNAENSFFVERYVSKKHQGHVLLTTRDANWDGKPTLEVPRMSAHEAVTFLLNRTGRQKTLIQQKGVNDVAERLGYLPLALEQAAAYMKNADWSFTGYLDMLVDYGLDTIGDDKDYAKPDKEYYQDVVSTTWKISFDAIKKQNELVSRLFNVFAYADSNDIPLDIFVTHREMLLEDLQKIDKSLIVDAVVLLRRYSLIEREGKDDYLISIHRLVQEVVRDNLKKQSDNAYLDCCFKVLYTAVPKEYDSDTATRISFGRVAKHVTMSILHYGNAYSYDNDTQIKVARAYNRVGHGYTAIAQFCAALDVYNKATSICEKILGEEHHDTSIAYNNIANVYSHQGDYCSALKWYQKCLAICEKILGKEHLDTITAYNNIACIYDNQGNYDAALTWHQKVLVTREQVLGLKHLDTATTYNNIASVHTHKGEYAKALEWLMKTLAICENVLSKEHTFTATVYNNIATTYDNQGKYVESLEWHYKALAVRKKVLGEEHPDTAMSYNNIAMVHHHKGDYDKALEEYQKALTIYIKVLGEERPTTAVLYHNIASIYDCKGCYTEALKWYGKALAVRKKVLGEEHPDTAVTCHNIANVYDNKGDYDEAMNWYNKALTISKKTLGEEHLNTSIICNSIAGIYYRQGDYTRALDGFRTALTIAEKVLGMGHPSIAACYSNIANIYGNQGDCDTALEWHNKALAIVEKTLGTEHPDTAAVYYNIALNYYNQVDYTKALEWYLKSYRILLKKLGEMHPNTVFVKDNMKHVYTSSSFEEPFGDWLKKNL